MKVIILAAGKGTRLADPNNPQPKVLREAGGRPLLAYVLDSVDFVDRSDITIVTGYLADKVEAAYPEYNCVRQGDDAYGTAYAVKCALEGTDIGSYDGDVLILNGDMALFRARTVKELCDEHSRTGAAATILSCTTELPLPYGRIIRGENGELTGIIEQAECTPEQAKIKELNVGMYVFKANKLAETIYKIDNNNAKGEYYLTDAIPVLFSENEKVNAYTIDREDEIVGVNTPDDLRRTGEILLSR